MTPPEIKELLQKSLDRLLWWERVYGDPDEPEDEDELIAELKETLKNS